MEYYSVVFYGKIGILKDEEIKIIREIHEKYPQTFYLKKSIKNGYNLSFNGIKNKNIANNIMILLSNLKDDYSYDESKYHYFFKKIKDPNYTGKCIINKISVIKDPYISLFQNMEQYDFYRELSIKLDNIFFNNYFKYNKVSYIFNFLKNEYQSREEIMWYNSHLSHFWSFYSNLEEKQKYKFLNLIKDNEIETKVEGGKFDEKILSYIIVKVRDLQTAGKIDFFSPKTYEELLKNGLSTKEHSDTMRYYRSFINDINYISNRWLLNLIYEKMLILNYTILDKYTINYNFALKDNQFKLLDI